MEELLTTSISIFKKCIIILQIALFCQISTANQNINTVLQNAYKNRWQVTCKKSNSPQIVKSIFFNIVSNGLKKVLELNPRLQEHIKTKLNSRNLKISCATTDKGTAAQMFKSLDFDSENGTFINHKFELKIPHFFTDINLILSTNDSPSISSILEATDLYQKNKVFHEFLHFLDLDNLPPSAHTSSVGEDVVYSCTSIGYDLFKLRVKEALESNSKYFNSFLKAYEQKLFKECMACSLATKKKRGPILSRNKRAKYSIGLLPNFYITNTNNSVFAAEQKCNNYSEKYKSLFLLEHVIK